MASIINQIALGGVEYGIAASAYAECTTAAATTAKVATICTDADTTNTAFTLIKGVSVNVKFTNTNTASSPTLKINSTDAKAIKYRGADIPTGTLISGRVYTFTYDGTVWQLMNPIEWPLDALKATLLDTIYPVGSIYISATNTSPASFLGGTWAAVAQGRTLIGDDGSGYLATQTGGAASVTLTTNNMPSHSHGLNSHTHTASQSLDMSHTHGIPSLTVNSHTHSYAHTHGYTPKGTISGGLHNHGIPYRDGGSTNLGQTVQYRATSGSDGSYGMITQSVAPSMVFNGTAASTTSQSTSTTGENTSTTKTSTTNAASKTSLSVSLTTGAASGNTASAGASSPTAISVVQPYLVVYMWQRTA